MSVDDLIKLISVSAPVLYGLAAIIKAFRKK
ncbi:MAG: hypothetical protein RIR18_1632 [Pseudomonadota bacterium]|jgi:hypothetical protein